MVRHPAKFSDAFDEHFRELLRGRKRILDPFAGTGRLAWMLGEDWEGEVHLNELEPEWANQSPPWAVVRIGDAGSLPYESGYFDAVCTSPCMATHHRVLTNDLRWVPCGDVKAGDQLIAFDEYGQGVKVNGSRHRRKWRIATVVGSYTAKKPCVRVWLENGDSLITTREHPWLASKYAYRGNAPGWVASSDLMRLHSPHVFKQLEPWVAATSYEAGWLAGMLDGEGSLSWGVHGSPKLVLTQVNGSIFDLAQERFARIGYQYNVIPRSDTLPHRQPMSNLYVNGGFPGILRALGQLRPSRLLSKLDELDVANRTIEPWMVKVLAVEEFGEHDVQVIETSTGTYMGEGYLMHNCYGNRMADHHNARDASKRNTYTHTLGRPLSPGNTGAMQWGNDYKLKHIYVWHECRRVLAEDGLFILNISDHIRKGRVVPVTDWHIDTLTRLGFVLTEHRKIPTPRLRCGANGGVRVEHESIIVLRRG